MTRMMFSVLKRSSLANVTMASMMRFLLRRRTSVRYEMPSGLRKSAVTANQSASPPIVAARKP